MRRPEIVIATAVLLITGAVNLQVPLYRTYAEAAGFGTGLTAVVFAAYVAGLLPTLILFGGISDRLGRKPILLAGLCTALLATTVVIVRPTMQVLLLARLLHGIGVGLSVGTATAYLAELLPNGPTRAARYVAVTTSLGFGGGALLTSIALVYHRSLVPASYWLVLGLTGGCLVVSLGLPARAPVGGALMRRPTFPPGTRISGAAIALAWAVTGLVIAVVPTQLSQFGLAAWAGPALFLVNGTGVAVQPFVQRMVAHRALHVGFVCLPLGYGVLLLGAWLGVLSLVLVGAAIAGAACYGFTYLGGLAEVTQRSGPERARAVSGYFLCAYLGFGLPSIAIGFLADAVGVIPALLGFGVVVVVLSTTLAGALRRHPALVRGSNAAQRTSAQK